MYFYVIVLHWDVIVSVEIYIFKLAYELFITSSNIKARVIVCFEMCTLSRGPWLLILFQLWGQSFVEIWIIWLH